MWYMLVPSLLMVASTLLLRLHYSVDLIAEQCWLWECWSAFDSRRFASMTDSVSDSADSWAQEAASLPLAFAQVREDPQLDLS